MNKIFSAFNYLSSTIQRQDLFQAVILGLKKAFDDYQDLGHKFITYATPR
ncbi:sigma factor [Candidatus Phytoplasma luffae]|nr:sigma factor [Candidatus Phytoplasma luffae]